MRYANNIEIVDKGMKFLLEAMGTIETERFISAIMRERFDYTEWRKKFFDDIDAKEFNELAANYAKNNPFHPKKNQIEI